MSREAMKQALEALESDPITHAGLVSRKQAITALRQALETEVLKGHKAEHALPDHNPFLVQDNLLFVVGFSGMWLAQKDFLDIIQPRKVFGKGYK